MIRRFARCRSVVVASGLSAGLALLAGCQMNPFLVGYAGERLEPVKAATVVQEPPAASDARELGSSQFTASTGDAEVGDQATAAACVVGADLVQWKVTPMAREEWVESDPVYERRASGRGQFGSYIPIPGSRERWKYSARFWRSVTSASAPAEAAKAAPEQPPVAPARP